MESLAVEPSDSEPVYRSLVKRKGALEEDSNLGAHLAGTSVASLGLTLVGIAAALDGNEYGAHLAVGSATVSGTSFMGALASSGNSFSETVELSQIDEDLSNTYVFDAETSLEDLLEESEELEYEDFREEETESALGLYDELVEYSGVNQILTVEEAELGHNYNLDIVMKEDLLGRFSGYTEEDIQEYLEDGKCVKNPET